jgi:hypothetical protein
MSRQTFSLTFRGRPVRAWASRQLWRTTSIYPELHVLLTYRKHPDGTVDRDPSVYASYKTAETCFKRLREEASRLSQWSGQSFVIRVGPGISEVVQAPEVKREWVPR